MRGCRVRGGGIVWNTVTQEEDASARARRACVLEISMINTELERIQVKRSLYTLHVGARASRVGFARGAYEYTRRHHGVPDYLENQLQHVRRPVIVVRP